MTGRSHDEHGYRRTTTTWIAFAALFAFGLLNAMLGPVLPYLRRSEQISYIVGALHQVSFAIGGMTAGILATRSTAHRRRTIALGLTGAALAGLLLAYAGILPLTILAALLISAFGTAALIRTWALLSDLHPEQRAVAMTEGEVAVSLAGVITPALVSVCAALWVGWRFSLVVAAVLVVGAALAVGTSDLAHGGSTSGNQAPVGPRPSRPATRRTLTTIFAVVGLEFSLSFWAASYLHDDVGIARNTAVALVSVLYGANLAGRLVASRVARRLSASALLSLTLATALAGVPILLTAGDAAVAAVGLVVTGIGIGGTFPLASSLHVAASRRSADRALGEILTVAGIGQIAGPLAVGVIAQVTSGLRPGLIVLPALGLLAVGTTRRSD